MIFAWKARSAAPVGADTTPNVVAVLPFRVTGADSSLANLREGIVDLLAADLTGECGPRAIDVDGGVQRPFDIDPAVNGTDGFQGLGHALSRSGAQILIMRALK